MKWRWLYGLGLALLVVTVFYFMISLPEVGASVEREAVLQAGEFPRLPSVIQSLPPDSSSPDGCLSSIYYTSLPAKCRTAEGLRVVDQREYQPVVKIPKPGN